MGAASLKKGQHARAVKLFRKSLNMYPLPGVEALLSQAEKIAREAENGSASASRPAATASRPQVSRTASTASAASTATSGADGRAYTEQQVKVVKEILHAKEGGRGAHYRVLGIAASANESEIKKAYRKRALKLHPDKNSAPHADEAFKAVGLAYATLSDPQKRTIYDRYGDEDPDNRGGGGAGARGPGGVHFRRGEEVNPEDIFNMFFGGGMPMPGGGGRGFHVRTNGFGPGMQFGGGRQQRPHQGAARQPEQEPNGMAVIMQFLPFLFILALSFLSFGGDSGQSYTQNRYFSLTVCFLSIRKCDPMYAGRELLSNSNLYVCSKRRRTSIRCKPS
jgi:DnaJ family protein B protein 12